VPIVFEDHGRFQRGTLHIAVASSALAFAAATLGAERFPPALAVLAAALATLALAAAHLRWSADPVTDALARAAAEADAEGRDLLARAGAARAGIEHAVHSDRALARGEARAVLGAAGEAASALAEVCRRRQRLARRMHAAAPPEASARLETLDHRAETADDAPAREAYHRAAAAVRERIDRAAALGAVVQRIDARLHAAVAELEGTALAVGTHAELAPRDLPLSLAAACDRLRAANVDLGAESDALNEMGGP
jgi:hypothetical protein